MGAPAVRHLDAPPVADSALFLRDAAVELGAALGTFSDVVHQADGFPLDLGPRTAEKRSTSRAAATAAEETRAALETLSKALKRLADVWGGDDG